MPVFNGYETVTVCDDKMLTALALAKAGVPQPDTLPGPLCYRSEAALGKDTYARMARLLGEPFVVKESFSSLGAGVHLIGGEEEFAALWEQIKLRPWLAQAYVAESRGRDVRVIVVGGRALGRHAAAVGGTDFRSNVAAGRQRRGVPVRRRAPHPRRACGGGGRRRVLRGRRALRQGRVPRLRSQQQRLLRRVRARHGAERRGRVRRLYFAFPVREGGAMKLLITGGAGFIGANFLAWEREKVSTGYAVLCG